MKRSEMIDIIKRGVENGDCGWSFYKTAKHILDEIEKVGILPPINNYNFHMDGDNANPDNVIYRIWEEEDESN